MPLQRQICGNFSRKSLIADTDSLLNSNEFPLQIQIPGSKRINSVIISATTRAYTKGGHATARFLEGFLEGSLKEVLLRRVLRRRLVRVSIETEVLRRVLRRGAVIEGA